MTVAACLKNRTDYIENPDKTEQGQFVSSYACSTLTADEEFMLTKRQYDLVNGRRQKSDVIAYQIRQSFRPGEITAEEANKVGYELAMRFYQGQVCVCCCHPHRPAAHPQPCVWGDRIFEKCGIGRDERGDGGKTLEIRGKRRLSARDGGANYQQS